MAETVKKPKVTAKAPKAASEPAAPATKKAPAVSKSKKASASTSNIHLMPASHEQIAQLAHKYWLDRGHQHGKHEDDWYRAEQELRGKAS